MILLKEQIERALDLVEQTQGIEVNKKYHPEKDLFSHLIQSMNWAFRESNDYELILTALLHDIGKLESPHKHESIGAKLVKPFVSTRIVCLIENHMRIKHYIKGDIKRLQKALNFIGMKKEYLIDLIQLTRFDVLARDPEYKINYDRTEIIDRFLKLEK